MRSTPLGVLFGRGIAIFGMCGIIWVDQRAEARSLLLAGKTGLRPTMMGKSHENHRSDLHGDYSRDRG